MRGHIPPPYKLAPPYKLGSDTPQKNHANPYDVVLLLRVNGHEKNALPDFFFVDPAHHLAKALADLLDFVALFVAAGCFEAGSARFVF